jgi:hypothetical protein
MSVCGRPLEGRVYKYDYSALVVQGYYSLGYSAVIRSVICSVSSRCAVCHDSMHDAASILLSSQAEQSSIISD